MQKMTFANFEIPFTPALSLWEKVRMRENDCLLFISVQYQLLTHKPRGCVPFFPVGIFDLEPLPVDSELLIGVGVCDS